MESSKLKRDLIILLVTSFIVIVCWIGFNIYSKAVTSTIDQTLTKQILPIDPAFDTATIQSLIERQQVQPLYLLEIQSLTPTPTPEELLEELPEETPTPTLPLPTSTGTQTEIQSVQSVQESLPPVAPGLSGGVVSQ